MIVIGWRHKPYSICNRTITDFCISEYKFLLTCKTNIDLGFGQYFYTDQYKLIFTSTKVCNCIIFTDTKVCKMRRSSPFHRINLIYPRYTCRGLQNCSFGVQQQSHPPMFTKTWKVLYFLETSSQRVCLGRFSYTIRHLDEEEGEV